jgi:hypothetical protein
MSRHTELQTNIEPYQARLKSTPPAWLKTFDDKSLQTLEDAGGIATRNQMGSSSSSAAPTRPAAKSLATGASTANDFFVEWDAELCSAWRLKHNASPSEKDYTNDLKPPDTNDPRAAMVAHWPDGWSHPIVAMTVTKYNSLQKVEIAATKWTWHDLENDVRLEIRVKADRTLLVWFQETQGTAEAFNSASWQSRPWPPRKMRST